ncbi:MAG: Fe-S cluster domain-containing protein [Oligoflexia bacterium]|nr:Fe-S cluster domain-containing protein [Oligoflexia bacterium]
MEFIQIAIWGVAVFTVMGLIFGVALAATAKKFHVAVDPLIDQVRDNLPSANCGACGFAGCQGYAEAVVEKPEVKPTLCSPGGAGVAEVLAKLTQKEMGALNPQVAVLRCYGTTAVAKKQAEYEGIHSCSAAILAFGGPKACKNGCLGLADCERACPFDAIHMSPDLGIASVNETKCTGCGVCVSTCPKSILELYPRNHRVKLSCVARDNRPVVRPTCLVGCIICRKCVKECPAKAISWDGKTIVINHELCIAYGPSCGEACAVGCPTHILHRMGQEPVPQVEKPAAEKPAVASAPAPSAPAPAAPATPAAAPAGEKKPESVG